MIATLLRMRTPFEDSDTHSTTTMERLPSIAAFDHFADAGERDRERGDSEGPDSPRRPRQQLLPHFQLPAAATAAQLGPYMTPPNSDPVKVHGDLSAQDEMDPRDFALIPDTSPRHATSPLIHHHSLQQGQQQQRQRQDAAAPPPVHPDFRPAGPDVCSDARYSYSPDMVRAVNDHAFGRNVLRASPLQASQVQNYTPAKAFYVDPSFQQRARAVSPPSWEDCSLVLRCLNDKMPQVGHAQLQAARRLARKRDLAAAAGLSPAPPTKKLRLAGLEPTVSVGDDGGDDDDKPYNDKFYNDKLNNNKLYNDKLYGDKFYYANVDFEDSKSYQHPGEAVDIIVADADRDTLSVKAASPPTPASRNARRRSSPAAPADSAARRRRHSSHSARRADGSKEAKSARAKSSKVQKSDNYLDYPDFAPALDSINKAMEPVRIEKPYTSSKADFSHDPERHLVCDEELLFAQSINLSCRKYLCVKRQLFEEYLKWLRRESDHKGNWNKTRAQHMSNIDVTKTSLVFEFFRNAGWFDTAHFERFLDPALDLSAQYYRGPGA